MKSNLFFSAALALGVMSGGAHAASITDNYTSFHVFGDSLSDQGLLHAITGGTRPSSPPYFQGRFSNGPVWAENIITEFNNRYSADAGGPGYSSVSFAIGGATAVKNSDNVPDMTSQTISFVDYVTNYSTVNSASQTGDRPLLAFWFGGNDILNAIDGLPEDATAEQAAATVNNAAKKAAAAVAKVMKDGHATSYNLHDFLAFNLPDIGEAPIFNLFQPEAKPLASAATRLFNSELARLIGEFGEDGPNVTLIDIYALTNDIRANPGNYGLSDVTSPCVFPSADVAAAFAQDMVCSADVANERAYFDSIHPNNRVHEAINAAVREAINPGASVAAVPLPATAPLLLAGLMAIGGLRRIRRQAA